MNKAQRIVLIVGAVLIAALPLVSSFITLNVDLPTHMPLEFRDRAEASNEARYPKDLAHRHWELTYMANVLAFTVLLFFAMKDINSKMKK